MGETKERSGIMNLHELPIILAGPIIRRVEAMCAYIWITTSKRYRITAEIYKIDPMDDEESFHYHPIDIVTEPTTVRLLSVYSNTCSKPSTHIR
jgi:hypothetical protein